MTINFVTQIFGWIGTAAIVVAYLLVSTKKLDGASKVYQYLNLFGALALGVHVLYQHAWPAVVLEIIWAAIAIWTLLKK